MRVHQVFISHGQVEITSTLNSMRMSGWDTRINDWIHTAHSQRTLSVEVVHGKCSGFLCPHQGQDYGEGELIIETHIENIWSKNDTYF